MTRRRKITRPVREDEGPWLIRSHYWSSWHRKSADGGAAGYTDDIAHAGVFGFEKARAYHDLNIARPRDEAIPVRRHLRAMRARLQELTDERDAFARVIETLATIK